MSHYDTLAPYFDAIERGENTIADVCRFTGIARSTVSSHYYNWRNRKEALPEVPQGLSLEDPQAGNLGPRGDKVWEYLKGQSDYVVEKSKHTEFSIRIEDDRPIAIGFVSDQHVGGTCDYHRMESDAELFRDTEGLYAMHGGDGIDNHIKHISAILHAHSTPDEQYSAFEHYLEMFGDSIVCMVAGNHDLWSEDFAGVAALRRIVSAKRLIYAKYELRMTLNFGAIPYRIWMRHKAKYNSMYNQSHSHQQNLRHGDWEWDIGVLAHLHEWCCTPFPFLGQERWAVRPGSYKVLDDFGIRQGYKSAVPRCPTLILYPDRKKVVGFSDVIDGARILKLERDTWKPEKKPVKRVAKKATSKPGAKSTGTRKRRSGSSKPRASSKKA